MAAQTANHRPSFLMVVLYVNWWFATISCVVKHHCHIACVTTSVLPTNLSLGTVFLPQPASLSLNSTPLSVNVSTIINNHGTVRETLSATCEALKGLKGHSNPTVPYWPSLPLSPHQTFVPKYSSAVGRWHFQSGSSYLSIPSRHQSFSHTAFQT